MHQFFLTFGCQYAHSGSWVRIVAPDEESARRAAFEHFGTKWSFLRTIDNFDPGYFAMGELFAFTTDENLNHRRLSDREAA